MFITSVELTRASCGASISIWLRVPLPLVQSDDLSTIPSRPILDYHSIKFIVDRSSTITYEIVYVTINRFCSPSMTLVTLCLTTRPWRALDQDQLLAEFSSAFPWLKAKVIRYIYLCMWQLVHKSSYIWNRLVVSWEPKALLSPAIVWHLSYSPIDIVPLRLLPFLRRAPWSLGRECAKAWCRFPFKFWTNHLFCIHSVGIFIQYASFAISFWFSLDKSERRSE